MGGAFSADLAKSLQFAVSEGLAPNRIYADVDALVSGEMALPENRRMEAVSIVTPNNLHFQQAKILLENGFHVICDKPVTLTSAEAETLKALSERANRVFCVTHTYTGYPMVRQMRELIAQGLVGTIQRIV